MFEKIIEMGLLFDFYGQLLTQKQKQILGMYCNDNYTMVEIAEELSVSRQAIYDSIKKAEKILCDYEDKLGLTHKFQETNEAIFKTNSFIEQALSEPTLNSSLHKELIQIKTIIDKLND